MSSDIIEPTEEEANKTEQDESEDQKGKSDEQGSYVEFKIDKTKGPFPSKRSHLTQQGEE